MVAHGVKKLMPLKLMLSRFVVVKFDRLVANLLNKGDQKNINAAVVVWK
jgi:hypothetical protein